MKRLIAFLLCAVTVLLCACGGTGEPQGSLPDETSGSSETTGYVQTVDPKTPLCDGKTLKILTISSSFGLNTTEFLYQVAVDQGATDVMIGRLFLAECTLRTHVKNAEQDSMVYRYYKKDGDKEWVTTEGYTMLQGLQDEEWDIIFLQHSATGAAQPDTFGDEYLGNYIDCLMQYVNANKTNPDARFVWNMTWAFPADSTEAVFNELGNDQEKMFNVIVDAVEEYVIPRTDFAAIIPSGTAIQNARTSYFGDTLNADTMHLNNLGKVIAGYMTWVTLTGKPLEIIDMVQVRNNLVLTDSDKAVIIEAVNNAFNNPYEITPSAYPTRPEA